MDFYKDEKECKCCCTCSVLKFMYRPGSCTCDCRTLYCKSSSDESENPNEYFYKKWAVNGCQLFYDASFQEKLLKLFDLNITTYFLVTRVIFIWVLAMFILGAIFTAVSFYTIHDDVNPATPICRADYSAYYMCPLCDGNCDFWYLKQAINEELCTRHFRLVFDNPVMWGFSSLVIASAFIANFFMIKKALYLKKGKNISNGGERNGNSCCLIIWQYCWMIIYVFFIVGLYFAFVLFSLFLENEVRRYLVSKYNTANFLLFILATVPSALIQTGINVICKLLYRLGLLHCLYKDDDNYTCCARSTHKFITTFIPNFFISYLPIIYRIIFFGNVVSDPTNGYRHVAGNLRFQHCPRYGCMDVGAFVFIGILGSAASSLFQTIRLTFPVKLNCCQDSCRNKVSEDDGEEESLSTRLKSDTVDHYVDLIICYGYIILFVTATGAAPLLAALITLPISARYIASSYLTSGPKKSDKSYLGFTWKCGFMFITGLSIFSNIAIVIPNSRFVQHISYSKHTGHDGLFLNFDGYLDKVLPEHSLTTVINIGAFPDYKAQNLPMLYQNGKEIQNEAGETLLFLPFINFTCLNERYESVGNSFTRKLYIQFIETHDNNTIVQYSKTKQVQECFNVTVTCRSRGFLSDTEDSKNLRKTRLIFMASFVVPIIIAAILLILFILISYRKYKNASQIVVV